MINRFTYKQVVWLDIVSPSNEEIREMAEECNIPTSFMGDLSAMTPRSAVVSEKGAIKLTLDFPIVKRTDIKQPHKVKMIATKDHLITIRFEDMEAIHRFTKEFEVMAALDNGKKQTSGSHLLVTLLSYLYGSLNNKLDYLETKMAHVEEGIFTNKEKEMLIEISQISRRLIAFRQVMLTHSTVLESFEENLESAFSKRTKFNVEEIMDRYQHVATRAEILAKTIDELRDTNNGLLSSKQNEIMKTLTIMAFITFPLTLFTSTFGMNTASTPLIGQKGDFWIIISIMMVVSVGFFGFFKYKKWI